MIARRHNVFPLSEFSGEMGRLFHDVFGRLAPFELFEESDELVPAVNIWRTKGICTSNSTWPE